MKDSMVHVRVMEGYIRLLWHGLKDSQAGRIRVIPADEKALRSKVSTNSFDRGVTASWLRSLAAPTFVGVRSATGHTIHVVSDRDRTAIEPELRRALSLMTWLSSVPLTWYWWDQPWVRELPGGVEPGPEHLNGGWAVPGIPEVHVYRREEALKVMIHESIHARLLDVPHDLVAGALVQFEALLGRRLWPHLGECYTELFAELLWAVASATSVSGALHLWSSQRQCSTKQAGQVWARIHDSHEAEETNVFAYYILKWVLMQHEEVFFAPNHCVDRWFVWFQEMRPKLEELRQKYARSESECLSLAMTCNAST